MVFEWAHWLKAERKKAISRVKSSPMLKKTASPNSNSNSASSIVEEPHHKYGLNGIYGTLQHALGYGSWWSVLLVFILVTLGGIAWMNAWLVDRLTNLLRRFGILPQHAQSPDDLLESLLFSASEGDLKTMNKLIVLSGGNKAILEAQSSSNELGDTVMHIACRFGHSNVVIALLNAGVSVEVRNRIGETPLAVAAESGHTAVAAVLLSRGADEDCCILETALKPLHLASMFNHVEVARLLIARRPQSLNCQEAIRLNTPLHIAVGLNHAEMVRFLLDQDGINVVLTDADGKTAFQLAVENPEIKAIFTEHGVKK